MVPPRILGLWALVVAVSALASLAGYVLLDGASNDTVAFVQSFAGGAILTMLATTMMPEAFENGGARVGIATTLGFATAYAVPRVRLTMHWRPHPAVVGLLVSACPWE